MASPSNLKLTGLDFDELKDNFKNLLPPLVLLNSEEKKHLTSKLNNLKFITKNNLAA